MREGHPEEGRTFSSVDEAMMAFDRRGLYEVTVEIAGRKQSLPFHTDRGTNMLRVVWP